MSQLKILIIEDRQEWQEFIVEVLNDLPVGAYKIDKVSNHDEAHSILEQEDFDLITLDMELSDGNKAHSGWRLIGNLDRGRYPKSQEARVIIISGSSDFQHSPDKVDELRVKYKNLERFLWKGSDWDDQLFETVQDILKRQKERDSASQGQRQVDILKLRQVLATNFNESELRSLCFDVGINYEDLPGTTREDKARELVAYFQRREELPLLLETCYRLRPNVSW